SASVYALSAAPTGEARSEESLVLGVPDPRAPLIRDEAESVAAILPHAELRLGAAATRQVLEERGSQSRWLHIATHGKFRRDHPMFSAINLGDGYLTLYDLYQIDRKSVV